MFPLPFLTSLVAGTRALFRSRMESSFAHHLGWFPALLFKSAPASLTISHSHPALRCLKAHSGSCSACRITTRLSQTQSPSASPVQHQISIALDQAHLRLHLLSTLTHSPSPTTTQSSIAKQPSLSKSQLLLSISQQHRLGLSQFTSLKISYFPQAHRLLRYPIPTSLKQQLVPPLPPLQSTQSDQSTSLSTAFPTQLNTMVL